MDRFLNVQELAEMLGVPITWIYDRTRQGGPERLPHYKVGKYIRFAQDEIAEYLRHKGQPAD